MNKKTSMLLATSLLALSASAQKITATQEVVNCGQVIFRHPATAEFELKNDGAQPLVIHRIQKSCGCMDIAYPQTSIPAGSTFTVKATYDAKQMGTFMKRLLVYSNASEEPYMLSMGGKVVERTTDFTGTYSGINKTTATAALGIKVQGHHVSVSGKDVKQVRVLDLNGRLIKRTSHASFSLDSAAGHAFVIEATDAAGHTTTQKVILK